MATAAEDVQSRSSFLEVYEQQVEPTEHRARTLLVVILGLAVLSSGVDATCAFMDGFSSHSREDALRDAFCITSGLTGLITAALCVRLTHLHRPLYALLARCALIVRAYPADTP